MGCPFSLPDVTALGEYATVDYTILVLLTFGLLATWAIINQDFMNILDCCILIDINSHFFVIYIPQSGITEL